MSGEPGGAPPEPLVRSLARLAEGGARGGLRSAGRELTLPRCWAAVRGGARRLTELGVSRGDRVALFGSNSIDVAIAYFAVHAAGGIAVPIGPDVSAGSARQVLEDCSPALILAKVPGQAPVEGVRQLPPAEELADGEAGPFEPRCVPGDGADLLFTTGTTGRRKGVLLTHANVASAAANINAFIGTRAGDVEVVPIPLSHSFGLGRLRCWSRAGHTLFLEEGLRNPALLFKRVGEIRATGLAIVPAGVALLRRLVGPRLREVGAHLRYVELGSAPLSPEDQRFLLESLPDTRICHHYGLTEASRAAFRDVRADADRPGTIGRASPNVEIRIADEEGRTLPPLESGEILVRGGIVMQGYWRQQELTDRALRGGWMRTGDYGWMDAEGYVYLRGRTGDVINVGGLKVSPIDVERRLCELPGVKEAACVGVADRQGILGQVVKAFVVSDEAIDERRIVDLLRGTLPEHELPRIVERVEALPKTDSGKIKRAELREREARDDGGRSGAR